MNNLKLNCPHGHASESTYERINRTDGYEIRIACLTCGAVYVFPVRVIRHLDPLYERVIGESSFSEGGYEERGDWRGSELEFIEGMSDE